VNANGRILCKSCVHAAGGISQSEVVEHAPHVVPPPFPMRRNVNGALLFLLSLCFPPGANYMYMGLIKRGLAAMCGFFLVIYLLATFHWVFSFAIPILVITCFFDSFQIRRRINAGEHVEDGIGDVLNGLLSNKPLAILILAIVGIAFAGTILGLFAQIIEKAVPILLVILALYIIFRKKK